DAVHLRQHLERAGQVELGQAIEKDHRDSHQYRSRRSVSLSSLSPFSLSASLLLRISSSARRRSRTIASHGIDSVVPNASRSTRAISSSIASCEYEPRTRLSD